MNARILATLGSLISISVIMAGQASAQSPVWANDLVPTQFPARNAVPAKASRPLITDNGSDSTWQTELRGLARISDEQTYQDTGDPVGPTNGIVTHSAVDLHIPGRGLDFELVRTYNSKSSDVDGPLGFGWDYSYDAHLQPNLGGAQVTVMNGATRQDVYTWTAPSSHVYNSSPGVYTLFKYFPPSTWILRNREGAKTTFDGGILTSMEDSNGNKISFFWVYSEFANRTCLDYVIDTMGRTIDFNHNAEGRLEWVQDFRNRRVEYYYDANGNLTGVRSPIIASTEGFNDFPSGRTERYEYLSGNGNLLDHKLAKVIRPNDVVQSVTPYGTPSVQFAYDTNPNSIFFGWCTSQILGGTNPAGTAGGTISYSYSVLDYTTPIYDANALEIERLKGSVTNREGYVTEYYANQNGHVVRVVDFDGTTPYTTTNKYNSEGELIRITQPNGNFTAIAYDNDIRLLDGNITTITHNSGGIPSDQALRTMSLEYEPIFNNTRKHIDFRGKTTTSYTDYEEGSLTEGGDDIVPSLQVELLDIYTREEVEALIDFPLYDFDLNGDGQQLTVNGNVVQIEFPVASISSVGGAPLAELEGDSIQDAWLTRTYNNYGQITSETDEEENVCVYLYYPETDPDGDGVLTIPSTGLNTLTGGYLQRLVEDTTLPYSHQQLVGVNARDWDLGRDSGTNPPPVNKTTDYLYDPSGSVTAMTDPRGVKYEYSVNELNEVWRRRRAIDTGASATRGGGLEGSNEDLTGQVFSFQELWTFDSNGNRTAHFVQNAGGWPDAIAIAGAPANHFESYWTYDILDHPKTEKHEYGFAGDAPATWTYAYDANQNRTLVQYPEGNTKTYTWDFRDQMKTITRGLGADASTVTFFRDSNGNLNQYTDGRGKHTLIHFDGFDRVRTVVQPAGTEKKLTYDAGSNVTAMSLWGHPGGPSPTDNDTTSSIELQRTTYSYDSRNRLTQVDRQDPQVPLIDGPLTPGDQKVTTVLNHDRLNRTIYIIDDDGSRTERLYDGLTRLIRETDPIGNVVLTAHDDNGNALKVSELDIYPDLSTRQFETFRVVDSLNRTVSTTDNIGRTERYSYDSRDNLVYRTDAVASLSAQYINGRQVNNPGNSTTIKVDGLGRVVLEDFDIRVGGTGDGAIVSQPYNQDGRITRTYDYDRNSRLRYAYDDNQNSTEYQYDTLDRLRTVIYANNTSHTQLFDRNDNLEGWTDAVGNTATLTYDDQNRLTAVDAVVPSTVVGTTKQRFQYDGLGHLTKSTDSVDSFLFNGDDWINEYTWDALSRTRTQKQNNRTVSTSWKEEAKKSSVGYTSGVTVQYTYDSLERVTSLIQGITLASFSYAGTDRLLQRTDYSGVVQRYHDGTWDDSLYYDGARRPIKLEFTKDSSLITGIEHGFDRANNRLYARRLYDSSRGDNYQYDSKYRMTAFERDVPAASVGIPAGGNYDVRIAYFLDGVNNRRKLTRDTGNGAIPVPTQITVTNVHDYITKVKGFGPNYTITNQTFDQNGNKTAFKTQGAHPVYKYDFLNRLRVVEQGSQKVEFEYDAEGRRVRTKVTGLAGYPANTMFIHDGNQVVEEIDGTTEICLRRFYYGYGLDRPVGYENLGFYPGADSYFYEQDSHGTVLAIHDSSGNVVERYTYGAVGSPRFETPQNQPKTSPASDFGNPYLFQGLRFEDYFDELYYCRARFIDCNDGSFMQRDPIGIWGDSLNLGNPKTYIGGNPINWQDPYGLNVYQASWDVGGSESGTHHGIIVTQGSNRPGEGSQDRYDGMPDNGQCTVQRGHPGTKDEKQREVPPPPGVSQEDWDKAVNEAGEEVTKELGQRGMTEKGTGPKKFPSSEAGHALLRLWPKGMRNTWDCWDVYDEILDRAYGKVFSKVDRSGYRRDPLGV